MRELDDQGIYRFLSFVLAVTATGGRVRSFVRAGEPNNILHTRERSDHVVFVVRHPRGSYIVTSLLSLEVATSKNKSIYSTLSSICRKVRLTGGSW